MKKILKLLLTLMVLVGPVQPTFAMMETNDTSWWTVDEMLSFYKEVQAEKELKCGDNQDCKRDFNYSLHERDQKYRALDNFIQNQFWITSVNPTKETIKVLFFGEEMMLKYMGIDEKVQLEHLYIEWYEDWWGQVYNDDYAHFTNDYMEGMHKMYAGISSIDGPGWIPAWEETELSVAGSNLSENIQGIIAYSIFAEENMYNAQGSYDYFNCIHSPDYQEGMECKMYVSGDQWISYFPQEEQDSDKPTVAQTEPTQPSSSDKSEQETVMNIQEPNNSDNDPESQKLTLLNKTPKAPETGANLEGYENETTMPLWLIILIVIGVMLIVWWFLPTENQKNRKKFGKNRKRALTKKANCDKMISV